MRRIIALSLATGLLASVALSGTVAAAPVSYTTPGTFTCDGIYGSGFTVALWSKNPSTTGALQVGKGLFFCEALNGTPYDGTFWMSTAKPATWAVISWSGVGGQCTDGPRAYRLPTGVVTSQAPCSVAGYRVPIQVFRSIKG